MMLLLNQRSILIATFALLALLSVLSNQQQFLVSAQGDDKDDKDDPEDDDESEDDMTPVPGKGGMNMDMDMNMTLLPTADDFEMGNSTSSPDMMEDVCDCDPDNMITCDDPSKESMCMCGSDGNVVCDDDDDADEPPKKEQIYSPDRQTRDPVNPEGGDEVVDDVDTETLTTTSGDPTESTVESAPAATPVTSPPVEEETDTIDTTTAATPSELSGASGIATTRTVVAISAAAGIVVALN